MLRVTLGGDGLDGFAADQDGAYVKLHVPSLETPGETVVRTYTIRYYREDAREIDIDFVLHDTDGPAARWAQNCEPGDEILVGGPGPKKTAKHEADWYLFAGDMSALPAISANLEALPDNANSVALIEVISNDDRQYIEKPDGVRIATGCTRAVTGRLARPKTVTACRKRPLRISAAGEPRPHARSKGCGRLIDQPASNSESL